MADKKISELNSLTGANAADGDLVAIVDVSATETKKITRSEFFTDTPSIDVGGTVTATGLDMNGNADFAGNIGLSRAASTILYRTDDTGIVDIRSATASLSGPSIQLYAGSHASFPNYSFVFGDTMFFRPVDGSPEFMRFVDGTGAVFNENSADHDFRIESDTNTHAFFLQGSDGDVGIGTGSPAEKLEVTGNIILDATDANIKIKSGTAGTAGAVNFTFNTDSTVYGSLSLPYDTRSSVGLLVKSNNSYPMSIASGTSSSATNAVILSTSGEEAMRVNYLGRVGIGDSAPPTILSVRGDTPESRITNTNAISDIGGTEEVARLGVYGQKNSVYGPAANIVFRQDTATWSSADAYNKGTRIEFCTQDATATDTSETPRMVINKIGNVGIGTSSPTDKLHISQDSAFAIQMERTGASPSVCEIANSGSLLNISQNTTGIVFLTGGTPTETMRITAAGQAIIPNGVTLGTAAGTYNAANTLDDYEEGTWTPTYAGTTAAGSFTYDIQEGYYTKIGNVVTVTGRLRTDAASGATGNAYIDGLPFTPKNVTNAGSNGCGSLGQTGDFNTEYPVGVYAGDSQARLLITTQPSANSTINVMNAANGFLDAVNANGMFFSCTYLTN